MTKQVQNAFTVDLEDWYQVANLEHLISYGDWDKCEDRLEVSTSRILDLLDRFGVKATFFVLGYNADKHPELVQKIAGRGHELGTHGYAHRLIYKMSPDEFADDLARSIAAVSRASGRKVASHRAPSFSITKQSTWAVDILAGQGITYDSSIFPVRHSRYGMPQAPRLPYAMKCGQPELVEFPISTLRLAGQNLPFSGGAYFRFLPYRMVRSAFRILNGQGVPVMFYLHPWEVDPEQPRMPLDWKLKTRCYHNIENVEKRLSMLFSEFSFGRMTDVIGSVRVEACRQAEAAC